ncbi:MAG: response regulator transcription factor [Cyclobacteriaceae bacterium]|nr:response regulator transcription factor [Cyclobacteriaceae bacterium]
MSKNKIKVYLAEDHTVVRKGMMRLLSTFERVAQVKEAANGKELVALIEHDAPDAVIMDVEMPVMGGVEAARHISEQFPKVKMLVLTMHTEEIFIDLLMDIGVHGFLSKSSGPEEVEKALYSIMDKDFYKNDIVERALMKVKRAPGKVVAGELSTREIEILLMICQENTAHEISERLHISEKTFFNHRSNLLLKTKARTNVGLLRYALENGYFTFSNQG